MDNFMVMFMLFSLATISWQLKDIRDLLAKEIASGRDRTQGKNLADVLPTERSKADKGMETGIRDSGR